MNVLVVGKFYTEGFALHIAETLTAMGHRVSRYEPGVPTSRAAAVLGPRVEQIRSHIHSLTDGLPVLRARRISQLWAVAASKKHDLVLVCHDFLWPAEVEELKRRSGAAIAMWFPDALANFGRAFFMNAPYDALFFKDPYILHALGGVLKSPTFYLPECMNPERHTLAEAANTEDPKYHCDITAAGNQHSWRIAFYKHLKKYDVKLWGNPAPLWMPTGDVARMYQGRPIHNHEKVRAFNGAKIVVNNLHYAEIWGVSVRVFEAAAAGAFQLVDWRPGLAHLFNDGEELVAFRSMAECLQKIDYWLPREHERRAIGKAGKVRAERDHTYKSRLTLLLATVAGREHGYPLAPRSWDGFGCP
jgi:spore maturation protein CgeB